ncbi:MAG: BTAD domain-containing putative transcriptional regulator [Actinophytocola sp.]|uniref:AfsR/SARP family transcriptional regulator n=1 Tax=Actinophytocola sp. TaxID=1872138 RepID=UPI003D6C5108
MLRIALLGEVTAEVDGRSVDLGPARQRCVLAALAVDAGRLVPADRLVERVWGTDTPRRGRATLHSHISRLRGAFSGAVAIVHRSGGYLLVLDRPDQVDLLRFRALCAEARGEGPRAVALLTEALALWQGDPLTGLRGEWVDGERERWLRERLAAEHQLVDARLLAGQGEELVAQLAVRSTQDPFDERVAGQYMLALHRAGRSADALDYYRQLRERLVEELGTDPGSALQDLHRQILAADPQLLVAPRTAATASIVVPRQLLAVPAPFVGRRDELDRLDATLSTGPGGGTALISSIGGAGGIGKTWLALTWGHRNLARFADGQLFVDLRGFSPTEQPAHPVDVLGGFLAALGIDRDRQPADLDGRAELYRSLVADKRMLVVLDNATGTDQVTPLLPGGHHCTVLVTSRNQLRGLIARHGARPVPLDVLTDTDAHTLLVDALGPDRTAADEGAIAELIELCGGFPLALGLIAARAAADPHLPLRDIVAELRTLGLNALDSDDPTASLPTVLSWSLRHLTDQQREVFALLGIAPGPDIGPPAAASVADLPERETHAVLAVLADASLIDRTPGGRYGMHDLLRAYATTRADELSNEVREAALERVLDYHAQTAYAADRILNPHRSVAELDPPKAGAHQPPDAQAAWAWFDAEYACLLAAQHLAADFSWHVTVWWLAWAMDTYVFRRGHRSDRLDAWLAAADAATHVPNPIARITAHRALGRCYADLVRHEDAIDHLQQALALAEDHRDPIQQAHTHHALARAWELRGDDRQALGHARSALDIHRSLDQPVWEADALNGVGWYAARLGDYDSARDHCRAALTLHRDHDNPDGEANTLDSLGFIDHESGNHRQAIDHYDQALTVYRDLGNAFQVADTLDRIGHPHAAIGQTEQARTAWWAAVKLYHEQGRHDDATRVQRQLETVAAGRK